MFCLTEAADGGYRLTYLFRLAERLAAEAGTDLEGGKKMIMDSLGGILLGRPTTRKRSRT
ncbi:hypothetical protein [Roseinatronobacter alkalisoli]|uniref:Uncharacterized protein n=1 Tax=Roseinatronobacter alkalisoli TaxID=3028235 RepID=A0ABT5TFH4_9RHOB|nr:hypothetical protein [Roseinatronobacter sp. HJB301]MDD7973875.1 hypothetical protein [Roseinatronobacter sp. HJB301]